MSIERLAGVSPLSKLLAAKERAEATVKAIEAAKAEMLIAAQKARNLEAHRKRDTKLFPKTSDSFEKLLLLPETLNFPKKNLKSHK